MQGLKEMLVEEQKYLEKIADAARKTLLIVPEGRLRISKSNTTSLLSMYGSGKKFIFQEPKKNCLNNWHRKIITKR